MIRLIFFLILLAGIKVQAYAQNTERFDDVLDEMQFYSDKAKQGDPEALHQMGLYYLRGVIAIESDLSNDQNLLGDKKAASFFIKAANLGYSESQHLLSALYHEGQGVPQNTDSTIYWSTSAAMLGNTDAQLGLGIYFSEGAIIEQDYGKAFYWMEKSATGGNLSAINNMSSIFYFGQLEQEIDYKKSVEWATKGAVQGEVSSQRILAVCYYNGQGIEKDLTRAAYWMNKARLGGDAQAIEMWNSPSNNFEKYLEN